jgi:Nitrile hydratase, alpha chain
MSATQFTSRKQLEEALLARAEHDETFRRNLLSNPHEILSKDFGITIPRSVNVNVVEESTNSLYLVLPARAAAADVRELSDRELEALAGGTGLINKVFGKAASRTRTAAEAEPTLQHEAPHAS